MQALCSLQLVPTLLARPLARHSATRQQRHSGRKQPRCQAPPGGVGAGVAFPNSDDSEDFGALTPAPAPEQNPPAAPQHESGKPAAAGGGGPRAAVKGVLQAYDHAVKKRPVLTKALTSFVGFALGDRIAQGFIPGAYDPFRAVRLSLYGLLIDGPVGHFWYELLDRHVCPDAPTSNKAVLIKTALDQVVWGPVMLVVFFAVLKTLEGHPEAIIQTVQTKFIPTMIANYALWPLAHLVNFKYVPGPWRIAFNNCVALLWTTYLSFLCGGPAAAGGALHAPTADATVAAASALLSAFPCSKVPGALQRPEVAEAARQVAAMEQMLSAWGSKAFPSAESIGTFIQLKAEVVKSVCQQPIRLPPP